MVIEAITPQAYQLLHEGVLALSKVEANGIRIDMDRLQQNIKETNDRITRLTTTLERHEISKEWKKIYRKETNFGSHDQLGVVLFDKLKYKCKSRTATGKPKTDEEALSALKIPYVKKYLKLSKLKKILNTYLLGIQRETIFELLHPVFSLHLVQTFRGSCEKINFQNIPIRIPWIMELIRTVIIPRPGHCLIELDYSGVEVRISCCYHHDKRLIAYVTNPELDMHRDMAAECYSCEVDEVSKELRHGGKNCFVFPQFYGDYYVNCARNLWDHADSLNLIMPNGLLVRDYLKSKGIKRLGACDPEQEPRPGTFEKHIQNVQADFWGVRFKKYSEWKESWWKEYQRNGGFQMHTGFVVNGVFKRNEAINYPVQGSAFHCLLKSLINIQTWIEKKKTKTKLIGQIHDSILADVPNKEVDDFLHNAKRIMTTDLRKEWKWINVPLDVDAERARDGESWADKKTIEFN